MRITMIGAGRLATNMAKALKQAGHDLPQVYSRTHEAASMLASVTGSEPVSRLEQVRDDADMYVIAVKDGAIAPIAAALCPSLPDAVFVHTAGSVPMDVFLGKAKRYGVIYPMQTFSKEREVDFSRIPCFVEGNDETTLADISNVAASISNDVRPLTSEKRRHLHLAAVFACNFTNHCYRLASEILATQGIPFSVMLPLIDETARKVHHLTPAEAQTGPAVRYDSEVIAAHLRLLDEVDGASGALPADVYRLITESIHHYFTSENQ